MPMAKVRPKDDVEAGKQGNALKKGFRKIGVTRTEDGATLWVRSFIEG